MRDLEINLEKLIKPEAAAKLRGAGLHKVAASLLKKEGFNIGDELTIKEAVAVLGMKLRQKNAEYTRIHTGLNSLKDFLGE